LDIAIAVLYVIVVLMRRQLLRRRGVILVALAVCRLDRSLISTAVTAIGHKRFQSEERS